MIEFNIKTTISTCSADVGAALASPKPKPDLALTDTTKLQAAADAVIAATPLDPNEPVEVSIAQGEAWVVVRVATVKDVT